MGEETRNAKSAVPFALFWSTVTNIGLGLIMIMTFAVSVDLVINCRETGHLTFIKLILTPELCRWECRH